MKIANKHIETIGDMVQKKLANAKKIKIKLPLDIQDAAQKLTEKTNPNADKFIK